MSIKKYTPILIQLLIILALVIPGLFSYQKYILGPLECYKKIYVSYDFDDDEFNLIKQAASEWNDETHGLIKFEVHYGYDQQLYDTISSSENEIVINRKDPNDPYVTMVDENVKGTALGYFTANLQTQNITLIPGRMLGDEYYKSVIIHEMGHAIGLNHLNIDNTIMTPYIIDSSYHITKDDLAWMCRIYMCNASILGTSSASQ